jgi:hypothetical protein
MIHYLFAFLIAMVGGMLYLLYRVSKPSPAKYAIGDKVEFKTGCFEYITETTTAIGTIEKIVGNKYQIISESITTGYNSKLMPVIMPEDMIIKKLLCTPLQP